MPVAIKKSLNANTVLFFFAVVVVGLCGACNMIGIMGSKSYYEQMVPAELMLKDYAQGGVLIFVDEAGAGRAELGLRPGLAEAVGSFLVKKARIENKYLVPGDRLSQLRSRGADFAALSPVQLGGAAGAAVVVYILITDYELYAVGNEEYYGGSLVTRSMLFDVASGRVLWPKEGSGRVVDVYVEIETGGRGATLERLIAATAHCITRSFYDCPMPRFRSTDEKVDYGPRKW